jgi:hypothetical protein
MKRNADRFPSDFMFQLPEEVKQVSQIVMSLSKHRGTCYRHHAFTEHEAIRQLTAPPEKPRREIRFHVWEKSARYRTRKRA